MNESEATGMIVEFRQALTLTEALDEFSGLLTVAYARDVCLLRAITTNRLVCCGNSGSLVECIVRESTTLAQMPGSEVGWMRIHVSVYS